MQELPQQCLVKPIAYEQQLVARDPASIVLVVIHCTELPDLAMAREYGQRVHYPDSGTGNCGHFYIDRDGALEQWVHPLRIAHHVRGCNEQSIGVELVNLGRYPDWLDSNAQQMNEPYPDHQLRCLTGLLLELRSALPSLRWIAGHEALDTEQVPSSDQPSIMVRRKMDPGPLFPWPQVLEDSGLEEYQQELGA